MLGSFASGTLGCLGRHASVCGVCAQGEQRCYRVARCCCAAWSLRLSCLQNTLVYAGASGPLPVLVRHTCLQAGSIAVQFGLAAGPAATCRPAVLRQCCCAWPKLTFVGCDMLGPTICLCVFPSCVGCDRCCLFRCRRAAGFLWCSFVLLTASMQAERAAAAAGGLWVCLPECLGHGHV